MKKIFVTAVAGMMAAAPAMADLVCIGGSRAQRDLQTNTLLAAYVNADRPELRLALFETLLKLLAC